MVKRDRIIAGLALAVLALAPAARAAELTGIIRGRITDTQGFPLPGAYIYILSDDLQGLRNYITSDTGFFAFPKLPAGVYQVIVEMPGFKTVNVGDVVVRTGRTVDLPVRLEATEVEEEITLGAPASLVDPWNREVGAVLPEWTIARLPLARRFSEIIRLAPGAVPVDEAGPDLYFSLLGSSARENAYFLEGIDITDPASGTPMTGVNLDIVEEVEVSAAAHPAGMSIGGQGAYVSVLTRDGGDRFDGRLAAVHTGSGLASDLWEGQAPDLGDSPPPIDRRNTDFSLNLGGPLLEERAWYFLSGRFNSRARQAPFAPAVNPEGRRFGSYDFTGNDFDSYLKITSQVMAEFRASAQAGYSNRRQSVFEGNLSPFRPLEATQALDGGLFFFASGALTYTMNQNTFVDVRGGYAASERPLLLNEAGRSLPQSFDAGTLLSWGSGRFNETAEAKRFQAGASITTFVGRAAGATHLLAAGAEYESASAGLSTWKADNLFRTWLDGDPYFYGTAVSPSSGESVGKGLIGFYIAPLAEGGLFVKPELRRLSAYAQDDLTFAGRIHLGIGLRFDHVNAGIPALGKSASGNPLSQAVGESLILPLIGLNPFDTGVVGGWDGLIGWNALSPRAGLSFDVFGTGRTVVKGSFARYADRLSLAYALSLAPVRPDRLHGFDWYDENGDGTVDESDTIVLGPDDYRLYLSSFNRQTVDPGISAPRATEWTAGLTQELGANFAVSLDFVAKSWTGLLQTVLFDPGSGLAWSALEEAPAGWWLPFTTVVPGAGPNPEARVTAYIRSAAAPALFHRLVNRSDLDRRARSVVFTLRKRMSDRWQLHASAVWSRTTGRLGLGPEPALGLSEDPATPNFLVNRGTDARLDFDRPFVAKVMGTYRLPFDIDASLFLQHWSGTPFARSVTIVPPESWVEANGADPMATATVLLETPGARRGESFTSLDLRVEKGFRLGQATRLALTADAFNVLGDKAGRRDLDDGGFWYPEAENTAAGTRVLSPTFQKYTNVRGARIFQLGLRLEF